MLPADLDANEFRIVALTITTIIMGVVFWASRRMDAGEKKLDALKILLMILWETGPLGNQKYIALSVKLDEIGRNLGGWSGQLMKQNSPESAIRRTGEK